MTHVTGKFYHSLSKTVSADTKLKEDGGGGPESVEIEVPKDGELQTLIIGWPASDGGVAVQVQRGSGARIFPRNDEDRYESTPTSFTHPFDLRDSRGDGIQMKEGQIIRANYLNYDTQNDKFVTVMAGIQDDVEEDEGDEDSEDDEEGVVEVPSPTRTPMGDD